ncbi:SigE family RNA polymerase sigma factor [Dactylosporangium aurantiacum]|uniref:SigE family RNA polymerase sigma factor n=1 Tax=Dactylosporangium aurantiacum TaxID=35754 RepID=A0A9Q9IFG0_9ACTN|nr:SigE family RNA polymerase sigma factor [Dactylosporangium aurantiacum]MDG6102053.1 SigE family RNA polymerase sigma factor [Dactylosporangium aurantiacum]UWZ53613.1 SigE family RNA polymerase sigma factor [Dactylosporangium aurantiacum]
MTFEEFVAARLGVLVRYATVVTCDADLAQDITQDVLIKAGARWSRIGRLDAPELYLKRMVVNEFLSWRRRRAAQLIPLARESLDTMTAPAPDPSGPRDERDAMLRLIAALTPRQRAVVALRFYEDMSIDQIADLMGCRPVTVRTYLARALATLREAFPAARVMTGDQA